MRGPVGKITAQSWRWTQCFWSPGRVTLFRGSTVDPCFLGKPWGGLWTSYQDSHSFGFKALSPKVTVGESKRVRVAPSSTATCLWVPLKYPKVPFNKPFPTPSIFTGEEVTWESICHSTWKRSAHGTVKTTALTACTPSLTMVTSASWQTAHPRSNLPFVFWLLCYKF